MPVSLAHRYSFSESGGSSVADSIGGPTWDGTLPNGGTFGGGQLALASSGQQHIKLPGGILSNDAAVTIETWVTFTDQLPANCFFFGFGNTNGSLDEDYIFCAPRAGRIAITSTNYTGEQNTSGAGDFSFHTNYHITAVFNPPAGYLSLYTNGVLAAINNAVTVPFSSVNYVYSYIGKSLYSADPYPNFTLDEFRIYTGALHADEITATQLLGPDQPLSETSPTLGALATDGNLTLSWPLDAAGFALQSRTNLTLGDWTLVGAPAPQIVGGHWQVAVPISGDAQFYRLQK